NSRTLHCGFQQYWRRPAQAVPAALQGRPDLLRHRVHLDLSIQYLGNLVSVLVADDREYPRSAVMDAKPRLIMHPPDLTGSGRELRPNPFYWRHDVGQ